MKIIRKAINLFIVLLSIYGNVSCQKSVKEYGLKQDIQTYWWNDAVYYEVFVRSFYDSNSDGIGDIQGLIQKLDYLNDGNPATTSDLGISALWLMPICESPSYHGYDVTDYKTINTQYGTKQDFLQLIDEAHNRGIKVIIDFVINHTSNQHPWFTNSASSTSNDYRDFYRWSASNPGYTGSWGQQVWHQYSAGNYYYGLFYGGMPDLNYGNAAVKDSIFDAAQFWLEDMNVDGFRLDAVKYIFENGSTLENTQETYDFWADFNTFYKGINADALAVGEAWDNTSVVLNYVNGKLDFCFEFDLASEIINAVNSRTSNNLKIKIQQVYDDYQTLQFGTFLTNHDQNRTFDVLGNDVNKNKTAAAIYLTLPGIPFIYYGEELGMIGSKPDENIRRPMQWSNTSYAGFSSVNPWNSVNNNYTTYNVASELNSPNSILNHYKKLISLRNQEISLRRGLYKQVSCSDNSIVAFARQHLDETIVVVINLANTNRNNVSLSLNGAAIASGIKNVTDLLSNNAANDITIDVNGDFSNWIPLSTLTASTSYIFKIGGLPNSIDNSEKDKVEIYPNPANDHIYIASAQHKFTSYAIYSTDGKLIKNLIPDVITGTKARISLNGIPKGIYFIKLVDGKTEIKKTVIIN